MFKMLKAFILPASCMCRSLKSVRKPEYCFHPILPNTKIMRLLAIRVFSVVPVISIANDCSKYQQYVGSAARKYNISEVYY